jgi:adenine deaminase
MAEGREQNGSQAAASISVIACDPALRQRLISVAQEPAAPDLLIRDADVWNAFTGELRNADIAICAERIASQSRFPEEERVFSREAIDRLLEDPIFPGTAETARWTDLLDPARSARLLALLEAAWTR